MTPFIRLLFLALLLACSYNAYSSPLHIEVQRGDSLERHADWLDYISHFPKSRYLDMALPYYLDKEESKLRESYERIPDKYANRYILKVGSASPIFYYGKQCEYKDTIYVIVFSKEAGSKYPFDVMLIDYTLDGRMVDSKTIAYGDVIDTKGVAFSYQRHSKDWSADKLQVDSILKVNYIGNLNVGNAHGQSVNVRLWNSYIVEKGRIRLNFTDIDGKGIFPSRSKMHILPTIGRKLDQAYRALRADSSNVILQRRFFDAFPNCWADYERLLHYEMNRGSNLYLYSYADDYVDMFMLYLPSIPKSMWIAKLVNIMKDSQRTRYVVDLASYIKVLFQQEYEYGKILLTCLSGLTTAEQENVWSYLFGEGMCDNWGAIAAFLKGNFEHSFPKEVAIMVRVLEKRCGDIIDQY